MPPMHALAVMSSYMCSTCVNEWHPTASTLSPSVSPKKSAGACPMQLCLNKSQMDEPREFSRCWAISNATHITSWHYRLAEARRRRR